MERIYLYERQRDGKRVEFFSETRNGKLTYLIREENGQDSVTTDRAALDSFRQGLVKDGYMKMPAGGPHPG